VESFGMVSMVVDIFVLVNHRNELLVHDKDVGNRVGIHIEGDIDVVSRLDVGKFDIGKFVGKVVERLEVCMVSMIYRTADISIYLTLASRFYFHHISSIF
jgi:hypothetical protein